MKEFTEKQAIYNIQTYLRAQRLINESAPIVPIDGIFDTATKNALIDFQLRNGLSPTGIADRTTFDLLYTQYLEILEAAALPGPIIPFPSHPKNYVLEPGDKSFLVEVLQFMLNEIGTVYNTFEALDINGEYDKITESTVKAFQEKNGLTPTGKTDRSTWAFLSRIYNLSMHYVYQK